MIGVGVGVLFGKGDLEGLGVLAGVGVPVGFGVMEDVRVAGSGVTWTVSLVEKAHRKATSRKAEALGIDALDPFTRHPPYGA